MTIFRLDRFLTLYFFHPLFRKKEPADEKMIPILMYHSISGDKETAHPYYHINTSPAVFAEAGCRKTEVGEDCGEPRCGPQVGEQGQHQTHRHRSCRLDGGGEDRLRHRPRGTQENHPGPAENQTGNPGLREWVIGDRS